LRALNLKLAQITLWKRKLIGGVMLSGFTIRIFKRRARKNQVNHFGNFTAVYDGGEGQNFDYGISYRCCSNYEF